MIHGVLKRRQLIARGLKALLGAWLILLTAVPHSAEPKERPVVVVFPDVPMPYLRIFADILEGIEEEHEGPVVRYMLSRDATTEDLRKWADKNEIKDVIALGTQAMGVAEGLPPDYNIVVGAVIRYQQPKHATMSVVSLSPDPKAMFKHLKKLAPDVDTVTVVYSKKDHWHQIQRAREVAAEEGVKLNAIAENGSMEQGATTYRDLIDENYSTDNALWILQGDNALKSRPVLYDLLKATWNADVVMFSSNPSFVRYGALFSMFPNNVELGGRLAEELQRLRDTGKPRFGFTESLKFAVNVRTAEHLNLKLAPSLVRTFDLTFPNR